MSLEALYKEIILEHYRSPRNFGPLENAQFAKEHENPTCGDTIKLAVTTNGSGRVDSIAFDGKGCAISMASASMMTELVKGKPLAEVKEILEQFVRAMRGEGDPLDLEQLGDIASLQGVIKYPVRVKCATLAWHALAETLERINDAS